MVNTVSLETDLKVSPQKIWGALKESRNLFPKILPSEFKSIDVIEGDGKSVGSIRLIKYRGGLPGEHTKERIEFVDEANKTVTYAVVEGDILNVYKTFRPTLQICQGADANSSLVKWTVELEPARAEVPPPNGVKQRVLTIFKALEAYLLRSKQVA